MPTAYSNAKVRGQRSVGSKDRVKTNGQTDGGDCITSVPNAVCNERLYLLITNYYSDCLDEYRQ